MSADSNTTGANTNSRKHPVMTYGIAAIFAATGVSGSIRLIASSSLSSISSVALVSLVTISFLCLLVVHFSDRVDWFTLKGLKVKLAKIEEKERQVRALAAAVADLAEAAAAGAMVTDEFDQASFDRALNALREKAGQPGVRDNPIKPQRIGRA